MGRDAARNPVARERARRAEVQNLLSTDRPHRRGAEAGADPHDVVERGEGEQLVVEERGTAPWPTTQRTGDKVEEHFSSLDRHGRLFAEHDGETKRDCAVAPPLCEDDLAGALRCAICLQRARRCALVVAAPPSRLHAVEDFVRRELDEARQRLPTLQRER